MKYKSLIIVPTRGRASRIGDTMDALLSQSTTSDIVVAIDSDEADLYERYPGVEYDVGSADGAVGMNPKFNAVSVRKMMDYDYMIFIADDVVPVTHGWDELLVEAIVGVPMGISYPDDGIQGGRLPSNGTCFDARIVRTLGFLSPPELPHLFCDNCWRAIGHGMRSLRYCDHVKVDHRHHSTGKSIWDSTYAITNERSSIHVASAAYRKWANESLPGVLALLKENLNDSYGAA